MVRHLGYFILAPEMSTSFGQQCTVPLQVFLVKAANGQVDKFTAFTPEEHVAAASVAKSTVTTWRRLVGPERRICLKHDFDLCELMKPKQ
jgi:hypothetical protein